MREAADQPSPGALREVRRLAGPSALVAAVTRLAGGQHAETWRVDTEDPATSVVVREFPPGDQAPLHEQRVLDALAGLDGRAPLPLAVDLDGRWSERPTLVTSRLEGRADITPADPELWARELGRALAAVQAVPLERLDELPSLIDSDEGQLRQLEGPLAAEVRERWAEIVAAPQALVHLDFWSGNVVWTDGRISGIVDWSGGSRGPRGFDLGWCRLDLVLLYGEPIADEFLAAYEAATGRAVEDVRLWDCWAAARSEDNVTSWVPNYAPLGRPDLDAAELRRRHARWTSRLL